jgi:outer membrane murein-binding lipoprotein Lpp
MMMLEKSGYADLSARVAKLQSAMDAQKAEMNAAGSGKLDRQRRRPVMRLG